MELALSFILGILGSIIASCLFLYLVLHKLRPQIEIAPVIALETDKGENWYWFKIINKSRFDGFDLKFILEKTVTVPCNGGFHITDFEKIPFRQDSFGLIPKRIPPKKSNGKSKKPKDVDTASHCFQVRTSTDLEKLLKDQHTALRLQVILRHGLTGLSDSFEWNFVNASSIKKGSFKFGESFEIES